MHVENALSAYCIQVRIEARPPKKKNAKIATRPYPVDTSPALGLRLESRKRPLIGGSLGMEHSKRVDE